VHISKKIVITIFTYVITTVAGFIGTLYFANVLGPGPLGTFALGMTLVKWLEITDFGVGGAASKRISEMEEEGSYLTTTILVRVVMIAISTIAILVFHDRVNAYVGGDFAVLIALMFVLISVSSFIARGLMGMNQVHIKNTIDTVERLLRLPFQAGLVFFGLSALALYQGYILSLVVSVPVGGALLIRTGIRPAMPERRHFRSLYDYAKFNILTRFRNRSFSWFDMLFLGFFVTNDAVGVYQVAWSVALTFWLVSNAISANLFPEVSHLSVRNRNKRIRELLQNGLAYAGIIPLPGLVGAALVGRGVLRLYGPEFVVAADLLIVISLLALIKSYEQQVLTALNSLDYPNLAFRVNVAFVVTNIVFNLLLIPPFELIGAAVATSVAVAVSLGYAWYHLRSIVGLHFPAAEVGRQTVSAVGMGIIVVGLKTVFDTSAPVELSVIIGVGAAVYFGLLLLISRKFRMLAFDFWDDGLLPR
jgi:O-antigen/teichoic acid export membrane protein